MAGYFLHLSYALYISTCRVNISHLTVFYVSDLKMPCTLSKYVSIQVSVWLFNADFRKKRWVTKRIYHTVSAMPVVDLVCYLMCMDVLHVDRWTFRGVYLYWCCKVEDVRISTSMRDEVQGLFVYTSKTVSKKEMYRMLIYVWVCTEISIRMACLAVEIDIC